MAGHPAASATSIASPPATATGSRGSVGVDRRPVGGTPEATKSFKSGGAESLQTAPGNCAPDPPTAPLPVVRLSLPGAFASAAKATAIRFDKLLSTTGLVSLSHCYEFPSILLQGKTITKRPSARLYIAVLCKIAELKRMTISIRHSSPSLLKKNKALWTVFNEILSLFYAAPSSVAYCLWHLHSQRKIEIEIII